ncbi:MAG TPA: flavodoxin family protein [Armatimonadota bacterium]|jgi:multimeric flavodoxin WrbA
MKVLGILGTPHTQGNTVLLLDAVLAGAAAAGAETEKVNLGDCTLNYCVGCGRCYAVGECVYDDDAEDLKAKIAEADGVVLASPNYINSVTAQLKTLMDRCSLEIHTQQWLGKYGAAVATAGGSGEDEVAEYANAFLRVCGAQTVGIAAARAAGVGALADQETALARAEALGGELAAAIAEQRTYPDQVAAQRLFAERMKQLVQYMAEKAPFQYDYWEKMGWL